MYKSIIAGLLATTIVSAANAESRFTLTSEDPTLTNSDLFISVLVDQDLLMDIGPIKYHQFPNKVRREFAHIFEWGTRDPAVIDICVAVSLAIDGFSWQYYWESVEAPKSSKKKGFVASRELNNSVILWIQDYAANDGYGATCEWE